MHFAQTCTALHPRCASARMSTVVSFLSSRIYRPNSAARPVLLSLPYFPPQDGMKSLNFHWTAWKKLDACWRLQLIRSVNSASNITANLWRYNKVTWWYCVLTKALRKFRLFRTTLLRSMSACYVIWLDYQSLLEKWLTDDYFYFKWFKWDCINRN